MFNTNELKCAGTLVSKVITLGKTSAGKEYASARLELEVSENNRVTLEMFANKLSSTGQESKLYANLMTIKDTYKSLDSQFVDRRMNKENKPMKLEATTVASKEECDFIIANKGIELSMNRYLNQDGQLMSNWRLSVNFVNRVKEGQPRVPMLEGNLYGVVEGNARVKEENGKEFLEVDIVVPKYRDAWGDRDASVVVEKFTLVLKDGEEEIEDFEGAMDYCREIFEDRAVVCVGVKPVNRVESEEQPKEEERPKRGFGKVASFQPSTKIVREIRIIGGYALEEVEYENDENFNFELYQQALVEFDEKIKALEENKSQEQTVTRGFGRKPQSGGKSNLPF